MAQQTVDAGVFQAALLQIAEATSAAANAAQAAAASATGAGTTSASSKFQVDWSKLVNKPPVFDFPNQEQDQRHFRDWLW